MRSPSNIKLQRWQAFSAASVYKHPVATSKHCSPVGSLDPWPSLSSSRIVMMIFFFKWNYWRKWHEEERLFKLWICHIVVWKKPWSCRVLTFEPWHVIRCVKYKTHPLIMIDKFRLRAISYFSLQTYCTRNLSTRAASREKRGRKPKKIKL